MVNQEDLNNKDFWVNKKVLLTGHTGFKGSWLLLWLLKLGAHVWGYSLPLSEDNKLFQQLNLSNISSNNLKGSFYNLERDICNDIDLNNTLIEIKPDIVFHLAAQTIVRKSYSKPLETWETNVIGTLKLLESLKAISNPCAVVLITSDKVYENKNTLFGYRENDLLGGVDPYSSSKAAMEILVSSWRRSFCQNNLSRCNLSIATARAGNVVGGGDWAEDRLVPDVMRSLNQGHKIKLRNPDSKRAWFHVLEPLSGYMQLAQKMFLYHLNNPKEFNSVYTQCFNFGPDISSNKKVRDLVELILNIWPGEWVQVNDQNAPHEAKLLHLSSDKAYEVLNWKHKWNFDTTIDKTVKWYKKNQTFDALTCCLNDLDDYESS